MQKILFLGYSPIWDRINAIPYLLKMKKLWKKIYLLEYDKKWYMINYSSKKDVLNMMKKNNLYEDIIFLPNHNKIKLIYKTFFYIFKYAWKFDEVYAPMKTFTTRLLWFLFWKHRKYTFKSLNDDTKYDNFVSGMLEQKNVDFSSYNKELKIPYDISYKQKFWLNKSFVTIFVWPYTRSLNEKEWYEIFKYIYKNLNLDIVLLWSIRREWWLNTNKNPRIIDLLWKTNFWEICSIIKDAEFTISANGWIMWLSHLLNPKSISFSITSWKITHPPVNNKTSFHIWNDECKEPCEWSVSKEIYKKYGYKKCIYKKYNCIVRDNLTAIKIIKLINRYYLNN